MHTASELYPSALPARAGVAVHTMHAAVRHGYGSPSVLSYQAVGRPVPGPREVLVRVHAAAATIGDHHMITGKPYAIRLTPFGGLPGPKHRVPGSAMAGTVEALGSNVTTLHVGDEVYGQAANGAFAEYVAISADRLAPKPATLSFEEAAAVPWAVNALQGLRDAGGLEVGQKVLINGASGGVGTWAVQLAKALGADVTAVCSRLSVETVRALGADVVLDYATQNFVGLGPHFDLMLDLVGNRSLAECRSVLKPKGTYVACSGGGGDWFGPMFRIAGGLFTSLFSSRKFKTFIGAPCRSDLLLLNALIEAGRVRPVIERTYPLIAIAEAMRVVGEGHSHGQTVIQIVS